MKIPVSFIVPCYKLGHLLPDCLNSILVQTYTDFEVLVMDNCSPDHTREVVRSFTDPRVRYIRNETNIGHVRNFNKGISLAQGEYVWLISADDFLTSAHALGRYMSLMERDRRVGYAFCRATAAMGPNDSPTPLTFTDFGKEDRIWRHPSFAKRLLRINPIVMSSVMARKECYESVGLFHLDLRYAGDWFMWSVLALSHDVAYYAEPMVYWRIHDNSLTNLFQHGDDPVCLTDELNVLCWTAKQAELVGVPSLRKICNHWFAQRAARALESNRSTNTSRPSLSRSMLDAIIEANLDSKNQQEVRALVSIALGDAQFWSSDNIKAIDSYRSALSLRPWWIKAWIKYLLVQAGTTGQFTRRLLTSVAATAGLKEYQGELPRNQ